MWVYVNGIPEGNIFGDRVKQALQRLKMPNLRGLAPGIMEDARDALNPIPILNSAFGSGYVQCKQVELPVGDFFGRLNNSDGKEMIHSAFPDDIQMIGNRPHQKRFVFDKWLTKEEYDKQLEGAAFCPDGSEKAKHDQEDCSRPILKVEPFQNMSAVDVGIPVAILITLGAVLWVRYRN